VNKNVPDKTYLAICIAWNLRLRRDKVELPVDPAAKY
jgi:hypothetical protein